jgi:hypothetical protein
MYKLQRTFQGGLISLCLAGGLVGCGSGGGSEAAENTPTPTPTAQTALIDATAGGVGAPATDPNNKYAYFSLSTNQVVNLTDAQAATSSDWDIAFKRANVKLNGGVSGPKGVGGYFTGNNAEAYDGNGDPVLGWFQGATADSELPDLAGVTAAQIPASTAFVTDAIELAVLSDGSSDSWWSEDQTSGAVSANPGNWWVVKSAGGDSYIKVHVTEISEDTANGVSRITLGWAYQASGEAAFADNTAGDAAAFVVEVPLAGGSRYVDFDAQITDADPVALGGWDMKIQYDVATDAYSMALNGGANGRGSAQAFGPVDDPDAYTTGLRGTAAGQVPIYFSDAAGGIFVESSWYGYNLTGSDNRLWPNYRVYLINAGSDVYKLQILSYYHPQATTSAWYSIRYQKVSP